MKLNQSWLMALCVVGMGAVLILPALGISIGTLLGFLLILLCPLSHFLMMRGMGSHADHGPRPGPQGSSVETPRPVLAPEEKNALEG
jgi:DUF2933 family protein